MAKILCDACGSNDFIEQNGFRICRFCGTKQKIFRETQSVQTRPGLGIDLNDDIGRLLNKCTTDPANAKRYANLILDIDANNAEAKRILAGR